MSAKTYPPELIANLRVALGAEGRLNVGAIAEDFGISTRTLSCLIKEHDIAVTTLITRHPISPERIEALRPMLEAPGHPALSRLAIDQGFNYKTLCKELKRHGVNVHPVTDRQMAPKKMLSDDKLAEIRTILSKAGHPSIRAVAEKFGLKHGSLAGMTHRKKIFVHPTTERADFYTWTLAPPPKPAPVAAPSTGVRYTSPYARKPSAANRLFGPLGKPKKQAPMDRAEMDRLIAEAVAAGKVTRCPPAYARAATRTRGSKHWGKHHDYRSV